VIGKEGELVITSAMPSMPVGILGDEDGRRFRSIYYDRFPGIWAHGDRASITKRGTITITGRSDGTLNRGGVRMGTAEFYAIVEGDADVADSIAVHLEDPAGGPGELMLFVVPKPEAPTADLVHRIKATLRQELSPRYVPDLIQLVPAVPRTLTGKKLEVPVKRILSGSSPSDVLAIDSISEPSSLDFFIALASARRSAHHEAGSVEEESNQ